VPPGISVKHGNKLKQLRAQLGNDIAMESFREGKLPFPDGAIIAALHWNEASSDLDNQVLASGFPGAGLESVFAASAVNVQFMVKDSKGDVDRRLYNFARHYNPCRDRKWADCCRRNVRIAQIAGHNGTVSFYYSTHQRDWVSLSHPRLHAGFGSWNFGVSDPANRAVCFVLKSTW
jgi:Cytochrome P460